MQHLCADRVSMHAKVWMCAYIFVVEQSCTHVLLSECKQQAKVCCTHCRPFSLFVQLPCKCHCKNMTCHYGAALYNYYCERVC